MKPLLTRKTRTLLVLESLEGRRLLSLPGLPPGWDGSTREVAAQNELAAETAGSTIPTGRPFDGSGSGNGSISTPVDPRIDRESDAAGASTSTTTATSCPTVAAVLAPLTSSPSARLERDPRLADPLVAAPPSSELHALVEMVSAQNANVGASVVVDDRGASKAPPALGTIVADSVGSSSARVGSRAPLASPNLEIIPTSHEVIAPPADPSFVAHPVDGTASLPSSVSLSSFPVAGSSTLPHGSVPLDLFAGQGSTSGAPLAALNPGTTQGQSQIRTVPVVPLAPQWETEETAIQPEIGELNPVRSLDGLKLPDPQSADMIMSLLPFDRSSIEAVVDQFLDPIEDLTSSITGLRGPLGLVSASLVVATTVVAVEVGVRLRRSRDEELEPDAAPSLVAFPGLPRVRRWSRS